MKPSIQNGDSVYIVDNARFVRMVIVLRTSRDYCIIRYAETGAVIRISKKRLYVTENEALLTIPSEHRPKKMNHWDYELNH